MPSLVNYEIIDCHPERNEMESRDLHTSGTFYVELVRRSFDSLRSLRMIIWKNYVKLKEGTRPSPTVNIQAVIKVMKLNTTRQNRVSREQALEMTICSFSVLPRAGVR